MAEHETPTEDMETSEKTPMEQFFYHQRRALEETRKAVESLIPPGFKEHSAEAGREFAKGFRVLIDAFIDEMKKVSEQEEDTEADETNNRPKTTGKSKVKVQVD